MTSKIDITKKLDKLRFEAEVSPALIALGCVVCPSSQRNRLLVAFPFANRRAAVVVEVTGQRLQVSMQAEDVEDRRLLRNILVRQGELKSLPEEHVLLGSYAVDTRPGLVMSDVSKWVQAVRHKSRDWLRSCDGEIATETVLGYWWDERANFGDAAGPWLLEAMTGKSVINVRGSGASGRAVASIGSLVQMMDRGRVDFWGSGLLYPPSEGQIRRLRRLRNVRVHAVRGKMTRGIVREGLGWDVPEVYGDPALLFPRFIQPSNVPRHLPIAFVPHKSHWKYFKNKLPSDVEMLSVADDVATVVSRIASSEVCISTSLHGLIFAQAYGIPWVWLNVDDDEIKGGPFKFKDFFSTLDAHAVARQDIKKSSIDSLDLRTVALQASLPELRIDLDALEEAFPLPRSASSNPQSSSGFSWLELSAEDRIAAYARSAFRRQRRWAARFSPGG